MGLVRDFQANRITSMILVVSLMGITACKFSPELNETTKNLSNSSTAISTASNSNYTCAAVSGGTKYDSAVACQTATGANCTPSYLTTPAGGALYCYSPVAGAGACLTNPPSFIYTAYSVQGITSNGYVLTRSLIGCSSTVCACLGTPVYNMTVPSLPASCTTAPGGCGSYVYSGAALIPSNISFTMTSPSVPQNVVPSAQISQLTAATIKVNGAPAGATFKIYKDAACSTPVLATATSATTSVPGTELQIPSIAVSGGGLKKFYYKISIGSGASANNSTCADTGVSFFQAVTPTLAASTTKIVPSLSQPVGSMIAFNFSNVIDGASDSTGMSYTCAFDYYVNQSIASGQPCSNLGSGASFNPSNGSLTWTPPVSPTARAYEICVTGSNSAGSSTRCSAVYLVAGLVPTMTVIPAVSSLFTSTSSTPRFAVAGAPYQMSYGVFTDPNCNSPVAAEKIVGATCTGTPAVCASTAFLTEIIATTIGEGGPKTFFQRFSVPSANAASLCLPTNASYTYVTTPVLTQPAPRIFPSGFIRTGQNVVLNFQATVPDGVSYTCKFDKQVNGSMSGIDCAFLPGTPSFSSTTGILNWTVGTAANGPYEICVVAKQAALNADGTQPQASLCTIVQVVPSTLNIANVVQYHDAQFATAAGGQNTNPNNTWIDLKSDTIGLFNYSTGGSNVTATTNAWSATNLFDASTFYATLVNSSYWIRQTVNLKTSILPNPGFTAEMWVRPTNFPVYSYINSGSVLDSPPTPTTYELRLAQEGIIMNYHSGSDGFSVRYVPVFGGNLYQTQYRIAAYVSNSSVSITCAPTTVYTYLPSTFHHITYSWDKVSSTLKLYIDGVLACSPAANATIGGTISASIERQLTLGSNSSWSNRMRGDIGSFRLHDSVDGASISQANYCAEKQRFNPGSAACP